jgi:FG-GAP-like repeat
MNVSVRMLAVLLTCGAALRSQTSPTLYPQQRYDIGAGGTSVALADLDADGALDVLLTRASPAELIVRAGLGDGQLGGAVTHALAVDARSTATGDLDGDGWLDVLVGGLSSEPGQLAVLRSAGGGALHPAAYESSGKMPRDVALGDFTGDGRLDAVVACFGSYGAVLHVNMGGFGGLLLAGPGLVPLSSAPSSVACGDFDGDGDLDAALVHTALGEASILLGNGHGLLQVAAVVDVGGVHPEDLTVVDLDADGDPDLATANSLSNDVSVLRGAAGAAFAPPQVAPAGNVPLALTAADLDGDGSPDLAVAANSSRGVVLLAGTGDGGLQPAGVVRIGAGAVAVAAGDLDAVGHDDLVGVDPSTGFAVVSLSRGCGPPESALALPAGPACWEADVADFDTDGWPDVVAVEPFYSPQLFIHHGSASGDFMPSVPLSLPGNSDPMSLHAVDMDGDGAPDLVMCLQNDELITVAQGLGDGSFAPPKPWWAGHGPMSLAIADFSLDGRLDFVVSASEDFGLWYLQQKPSGAFASASYVPVDDWSPGDIAVGDLDEDGWLDIVGTREFQGDLLVLMAEAPGSWGAPVEQALATQPEDLVLADLGGDGHLDALTADGDARSVSVFTGNGQGGFAPPVAHALPGAAPTVDVGDVDSDGALDVLACSTPDDSLVVLRGLGGGLLDAAIAFGLGEGEGVRELRLADANADGRLDAVTANSTSGDVSVLLQNGGWLALPGALAGEAGAPVLGVHGWPVPGAAVELGVCHAAASQATFVIAGLSELGAPFKGGLLVPAPDLVMGPAFTAPDGALGLVIHWPALPPGAPIWLQIWIVDAEGPAGFAATNALRVISS